MNFSTLASLPLAERLWLGLGFAGQICFGSRFLVQWIASEKKQKSHIPLAFWYLSLGGGLLLFSYAVYRQDPVFIMGQAFGAVVYIRNLILIKREKTRQDY